MLAGGVMTDKKFDPGLIGEIEAGGLLPALTDMAGGAARLVRGQSPAKRVEPVFLAKGLPGRRVHGLPGPVDGTRDLSARLGMAAETGFGDGRSGLERALHFLSNAACSAVSSGMAAPAAGDDGLWASAAAERPGTGIALNKRRNMSIPLVLVARPHRRSRQIALSGVFDGRVCLFFRLRRTLGASGPPAAEIRAALEVAGERNIGCFFWLGRPRHCCILQFQAMAGMLGQP